MSNQTVARTDVLAAAQKLVTRGWKADHMGFIFDPAKPGERLGPIQIKTTGKKRRTYAVINLSSTIGEQFNTAESIAAGELYGTLEVHDFWTGELINSDHAGRVEALMETAKQIEKGAK
jgi:ribosomal protein L31